MQRSGTQSLAVHGWIYSIKNGKIHDLDVTIAGVDDIAEAYRVAKK
jgi:carbonic anhydrase